MKRRLKNNLYLWGEIVGGNCPAKEEVPTFSHFLFWYIILIIGTMKEIKLNKGFVAHVDDWNYEWLNKWKWRIEKSHKTYYAIRTAYNPKRKISMHRLIMNTPRNMETDHADRNGLNNQEHNLKICNHSENQLNKRNWGKSSYRGVNNTRLIRPNGKKYPMIIAQINIKGKITHLGLFKTEEEAARAYDAKAKEVYGKLANLNFKD